jgi:RNA polymerase sigma-70 factor (family 1)
MKSSPFTGTTDHLYLQRIANGDEHAFGQLFTRYYAGLVRFARSLLPYPGQEAEDIVSDVFCHLWKNRTQLQVQQSLAAYLFVAVKNRVMDHLKKKKLPIIELHPDAPEPADDGYAAPESLLVYKELDQLLTYLITQLPPRSRLVFSMHRDENLTYEEIAVILGISVNSVKTHMFRALRYLKNKFPQPMLPNY